MKDVFNSYRYIVMTCASAVTVRGGACAEVKVDASGRCLSSSLRFAQTVLHSAKPCPTSPIPNYTIFSGSHPRPPRTNWKRYGFMCLVFNFCGCSRWFRVWSCVCVNQEEREISTELKIVVSLA